jgi:methyl acetate hydrolase
VNIDWLGKIVEQQRGMRLGEVMKERIFGPLGIQDMAFTMSDSMKARRVTIHNRAQDGKLTPQPDLALPQPPELEAGGLGLYSTVGEYMKFIRMFLNDGAGPNGRVLKAETVQQMCEGRVGETGPGERWLADIDALDHQRGRVLPGRREGWGLHVPDQSRGDAVRTPGRVH